MQNGLTLEKANALVSINDFYNSIPEYNSENIAKLNKYLQILNQEPQSTLEGFKNLIKNISSEDDSVKIFIINTGMKLDFSIDEKIDFLVECIEVEAEFKDGKLIDSQLSIAIALSYLSAIPDEDKKNLAIHNIWSNSSKSLDDMNLIKDFFPNFDFK